MKDCLLYTSGLKEEKYDIAFCSRKEKESGIDFVPIAKEKLVVVVPRDHELAGRGSVDLKETLPYPQVYITKNSGLRPVIDQLFEQTGGTPKIAYEILEDASMAGLVAENFGIAAVSYTHLLLSYIIQLFSNFTQTFNSQRNPAAIVFSEGYTSPSDYLNKKIIIFSTISHHFMIVWI